MSTYTNLTPLGTLPAGTTVPVLLPKAGSTTQVLPGRALPSAFGGGGGGVTSYTALTDKPTIPTQASIDAKMAKTANLSDLTNIPEARQTLGLKTVAITGDYNDLDNKPTGGGGGAALVTRTLKVGSELPLTSADANGLMIVARTTTQVTTIQLIEGMTITIVDGKGDSPTVGKITVLPPAGKTIRGDANYVIDVAYGGARFFPVELAGTVQVGVLPL